MSTHVIPVEDLIEHERRPDCPCEPHAEPVKRVDGAVVWHVIHHALDGREASA